MATAIEDFKKIKESFEFILQQGVDCYSIIWAKHTALNRVIEHGYKFHWNKRLLRLEQGRILICIEYDVEAGVNGNYRLDDPFISTVSGTCVFNKENIVKLLLEYGLDVNAKDCHVLTPLHLAVFNREKEIIKILLQNGANVNVLGGAESPIHLAISCRSEECVKLLLEYGADLNVRNLVFEETPLHDAVYHYPEIVRVVLDAGADVNITNDEGQTALDFAMNYRTDLFELPSFREALKVIYQHVVSLRVAGLYVSEKNIQAMSKPTDELQRQDWFDTFKSNINLYELECGQELEKIKSELGTNPSLKYILTTDNPRYLRNETLAQQLESINYNDFPIYANLLKRKLKIDKKNLTLPDGGIKATAIECFKKIKESFEFILQQGVDCYSIIWAKHTAIKRVIEHGNKFYWRKRLLRQEKHGILICIEYDVKEDVDGNYKLDAPFISTVSGTCVFNRANIVKLLLEHGLDVNATDCKGLTPLHQALRSGKKEIFKLLLQKGADVDAGGINATPLHTAIALKREEYVKLLLENGANLNIRSWWFGLTPLHFAVDEYPEIVRVLLNAGADVNFTTTSGITALDIAMMGSSSSREALKVIYQHIVSLRVAGLYVSEKNIQAMNETEYDLQGQDWFHTFESNINLHKLECGQELERIKSELGTNPSFQYILTTNNPRYLRNEALAQQLESINYNDFPIYGNLFKRKHENDKKNLTLLDGGLWNASSKRQKN